MKTVVGIFKARQEAAQAANLLKSVGFEGENVVLLAPRAPDVDVEAAVPTEDAEQPGIGKAIGSVVGGAVGLGAGAMIANLVLPGIGPVLALMFGAAAGWFEWRRSGGGSRWRTGKRFIYRRAQGRDFPL